MKVEEMILKKLKSLSPYIYCKAKSGSIYIKFNNSWVGSIRIGNHEGIPKYTYKWNLRYDIESYYEDIDRGVLRKYYPISDIDFMIKDILDQDSIKTKNISYNSEGITL